jgi:serine/threonine-protein kinase RsbW
LVNAIKHGNHNDPIKQVRISADVSNEEAKFIVEDEGEGFDNPPNPLSDDNLYKASGRGVLLIKSIMDEAHYNKRGNVVTMIKKKIQFGSASHLNKSSTTNPQTGVIHCYTPVR